MIAKLQKDAPNGKMVGKARKELFAKLQNNRLGKFQVKVEQKLAEIHK